MKKKICIRLFCVLTVLGCGLSCAGGYYIHNWQKEKKVAQKEITEPLAEVQVTEPALGNTLESSVVVQAYEFVLGQEDGYVVVYYADGENLHSRTDIPIERLSLELQEEILAGKAIANEAELYNFLENYSS